MPDQKIDPISPVDIITKADYTNVTISSAVAIPLNGANASITIDKTSFPNVVHDVLKCRIELSLDGGLTFCPKPSGEKNWPYGIYPVEITVGGNTGPDAFGRIGDAASINVPIHDKQNPLRQIRTVLTPLQKINTKVSMGIT